MYCRIWVVISDTRFTMLTVVEYTLAPFEAYLTAFDTTSKFISEKGIGQKHVS